MTKPHRISLPLAMFVLVLSVPVGFAWVIGDLTNEAARQLAAGGVELDYLMRPVSFGPIWNQLIGILACIGALGAFGTLIWGTATRQLDHRWWWFLLPLVGAGAIVGHGWRVLTAGVIGANIGAGLMIMVYGPVLAVLLMAAAVAARKLSGPPT